MYSTGAVSDGGSNTGGIVGGVVGGIVVTIVFLLLIIIVLLVFYCIKKREKSSRPSKEHVCADVRTCVLDKPPVYNKTGFVNE